MDFRTKVELPKKLPPITHAAKLLLMGSCFAENMGQRLTYNKFTVDVNPYGILYNPISVATVLRELLEGKIYRPCDLFLYQAHWHSYMHHGCFSASTVEDTLDNINSRLSLAHENMKHLDWLLLTFGTAYVYELKDSGTVVSNCHKQSEKNFSRRLLSVDEIVSTYSSLITEMTLQNPKLKLLFTVSPIRHIRDGMHANQLSKSVLLLAIDQLQHLFPQHVYYFPSYEIVIDELRDYRFYADDMLHPSSLAIDYLWETFADTFFSHETKTLIAEVVAIRKDLNHRPIHPSSETYQRFLEQLMLKIEQLIGKYPYLDFQKETESCHIRLNS